MSFHPQNKMIMDILENGTQSRYADYFDIDWHHPYQGLTGKLLAPFLGKFYGDGLDAGELVLEYDSDGFKIRYFDTRFPISIESYDMILSLNLDSLKRSAGPDNDDLLKLMGVLYSIRSLPSGAKNVDDRYSQIMFIKKLLCEIYESCTMIKVYIDETLKIFNGTAGNPRSFDLLDSLLAMQNYRLAYWKVGTEEINYRRFFTVNELISLRIENQEVFDKIHAYIFQLVVEKMIDGLRIDHIDGLHEPTNYIKRLREKYPDLYIVVKKILELNEDLPIFWPIEGTTGYDYLNFVNGIFCKPENEEQFDEIYSGFIESSVNYAGMLKEKKKLILGRHLVGDVDNFTRLLFNLTRENRHGNDFTIYGLRKAFKEFLSEFSIYRTYICQDESRNRQRLPEGRY
jgi:(1->4)-alpha-D-glucan 1-alpha-D-glucosylmutase